jgi:hypothetical protein
MFTDRDTNIGDNAITNLKTLDVASHLHNTTNRFMAGNKLVLKIRIAKINGTFKGLSQGTVK